MATRRVWATTTEGGTFEWRDRDDAFWHIEMMQRWSNRIGRKERMTLKSYVTTKE